MADFPKIRSAGLRGSYRDGINRAADEVQIVCDRLDKAALGEELATWLRKLSDDPAQPHPGVLHD